MRHFESVRDTAQEPDLDIKYSQETIRNDLFDRIINSGIECYAALRIDVGNQLSTRLFRGQVGKIENVILNNEEKKHYYSLVFIDYKKDRDVFNQCLVKKENLLPLFCFDPEKYDKYKELNQTQGINELRKKWDSIKFEVTPKLELAQHKKVENQFQVGQLVTMEVDFEQKTNSDFFIIQAGQTGIISKDKIDDDNNVVEVTFWSIPFGLLALIKEDFLPSSVPSPSKTDFNPLSFATSSWEKKIFINKNYLLPLYVEDLNVANSDVEELR